MCHVLEGRRFLAAEDLWSQCNCGNMNGWYAGIRADRILLWTSGKPARPHHWEAPGEGDNSPTVGSEGSEAKGISTPRGQRTYPVV